VHAAKLPQPGTEVEVDARSLANGTFAEAGGRVKTGTASGATLSGIVTYLDPTPAAPAYAISKRGVSVLVRLHPDPSGAPAALPALGTLATATVGIESPPAAGPETAPVPAPTPPPEVAATTCAPDPALPAPPAFAPAAVLWQRDLSAAGVSFTFGDFEGIVVALCPDSGELLVSADDIRQGLRDLLFTVPPDIETDGLEVGESIAATATIGPGGSLSLTGLASDEHAKGAGDYAATRGDLTVSEPK
jgi:hypothetical protein